MEEWKDASWTQGVFQVSNYGRVYNTKTKRFLNGYKTEKGYIQIVLGYKGKRESWLLHDLVATVWQRPLVKGEDAHHKIKQLKCCNCIWNIEIKEHSQHLREHKTGVKQTEEHKRNRAKTRIGKKMSQQAKLNMSLAKKGKPSPKKGTKRSPEAIAKMVQTRKLKKQLNPNYGPKKDPITGHFLQNR